MMLRNIHKLAVIAFGFVILGTGCKSDPASSTTSTLIGNWKTLSSFDGNGRQGAVSFVIGDSAYVATGFDGTNRYTDMWVYNDVTETWRNSREVFPGVARNSAMAFTIGTKAYIVGGFDGLNRLQDCWEFDQVLRRWTRRADLPDLTPTILGSGARYGGVGFAIGNKGYICGGYNGSHQKDLWSYNPTTNSWTQEVSMGGQKRQGATVLVYQDKAYVFGGSNNGVAVNDMWQFDPANAANPWKAMRNITNTSSDTYDDLYTDIIRSNATAFIVGTKGYVTNGENGSFNKSTWEYDFAKDEWTRKNAFERQERSGGVGFTVKGKGIVALGRNSTFYWDDVYRFFPDAAQDLND